MKTIIIDCDPGVDDAVALLLALASSDDLGLLGITTVAGNVALSYCTENALKICELADKATTPVYPGCARPILKSLITAPEVHGNKGLAGSRLPSPKIAAQSQHGVDFIIDAVRAHDDVILCPIGPLTNIALALIKAPDIAARIQQIVLMGGARSGGNVTPAAEFNIYVDPHAAQVVFSSGIPIVMFGLDLTLQVLVTPDWLRQIGALGSAVSATVVDILNALPQEQIDRYGGSPLHDPCAIAYLLKPELFVGKNCHVEVATDAGPAQGQTVVDWWGKQPRPAHVTVMHRVDVAGLFALLSERLARYSG